MLIDKVTAILREAAEVAILPRFRALADGDVTEKGPGDLVTVADREAEVLITRRLRELVDAPVVGEEATADDPGLLTALQTSTSAWVVDPVDGTANFVAGKPEYAVMAALIRDGSTVAAWILQPATDRIYTAERGSGTFRDGVRVHRSPAPAEVSAMRGSAPLRYLDPAARTRVREVRHRFADLGPGSYSAGVDYPRIVDGEQDFALYQRGLPWDHAPGSLLVTEAGGVSRRPDGSDYQPADARPRLLAAADPACWDAVGPILLPPDRP